MTEAFKILQSDPRVSAILVNIFGGIMKCDTIANGIVAAARKVNLSVPLVVRLEGTNVALGRDIISKSGLPIATKVLPTEKIRDFRSSKIAATDKKLLDNSLKWEYVISHCPLFRIILIFPIGTFKT